MHRVVKIGFGLLAFALAGAGHAQLVEQSTRGAKRICSYRAPPRVGSQNNVYRVEIGRGEPCPAARPRPDTRPPTIPAMATLTADRIEGGRRLCTYSDYGGEYRREISVASRCPLTPHF